jgi:hypothetical protein
MLVLVPLSFFLLSAFAGCVGFYKYRDTLVTVTDRSSGEPVAGVSLTTVYQADLPGLINDPRIAHAVTSADGTAIMSIATWWDSALVVGDDDWFSISNAFATDERGTTAFFGHDSKALAETRELEFAPARFVSDTSRYRVVIAPVEAK